MKNEIQLVTTGNASALTIREGQALALKEPNVISITGDIDTVKAFVAKRYQKPVFMTANTSGNVENSGPVDAVAVLPDVTNLQQIDASKAVVTFDKTNLTISLQVDPQDFYGPKVTGSLVESDELKPFCINKADMFSREELVKLIRFNKRHFKDAAKHDTVLKAFQSLSLTGATQLKAESDNRGNKNALFDKKLDTTGVPTIFVLSMPIFKGQPAKEFVVEVCIESSESKVVFWFESVELKELQDSTVETIFKEQKELFADFVVVNK